MDINMPEMTGVEATLMLRKKHFKGAIIAVTANAMAGDKEYYISKGMNDYISKPIDESELLEMLKRYLDEHSIVGNRDHENPLEDIILSLQDSKFKTDFTNTMIRRLFDSFLDSSMDSIGLLRKAIAEKDILSIKNAAHSIRGSALFLNLTKISDLSHQIEYEKDVDYESCLEDLTKEINFLNSNKSKIRERIDAL